MKTNSYPAVITRLPEADVPLDGIRGWLSQGQGHQILFVEIDAGSELPAHSHGDQWGIVVEGEMDLTIGGDARRYRAGDSYHIPAGTVHQARFLTQFRAIDVFADADRYAAKVG